MIHQETKSLNESISQLTLISNVKKNSSDFNEMPHNKQLARIKSLNFLHASRLCSKPRYFYINSTERLYETYGLNHKDIHGNGSMEGDTLDESYLSLLQG